MKLSALLENFCQTEEFVKATAEVKVFSQDNVISGTVIHSRNTGTAEGAEFKKSDTAI